MDACPYCGSQNTLLREIIDHYFDSSSASSTWKARCNDRGKSFYVYFNYAMVDFFVEPLEDEESE